MIKVENLSKSIKEKSLLENVSFSLDKGDILGFIGNNGAGKTTTIKTIFQEYKKNAGEITFDGHPLSEADLKIMEFFPDQNNFPKNYSVKRYCLYNYKLSNPNFNKAEFLSLFTKTMEALKLSENLNDKFSQLSSGMQKKALLGAILLTKPKVIILDEPTANLDVENRREFINVLKQLVEKMNLSILITSHDIDELETFINKVVFIDKGKIILEKKYDKSKEKLSDIYNKTLKDKNNVIDAGKLGEIFTNED